MKRLSLRGLLELSAMVVLMRVAGAVLALAFQVYLARWLGASDLGTYVLMVAIAGTVSILCCLGFPSITPRFVPGYLAENRADLSARFVRASRLHLLFGTAAALILAGLVAALPEGTFPPHVSLAVITGLVAAPFIALVRLNGALALSVRLPLLSYLPDLFLKPALLLLGAGLMAWFIPDAGVHKVLMLFVAIVAALALGQAVAIKRRNIVGQWAGEGGAEAELGLRREWRQAAYPMTIVVLLTAFIGDLDLLMLALLLPVEDVAVFSICLRLSLLIGFGLQVVFQLLMPDLSGAFKQGKMLQIRQSLRMANGLTTLVVGLATAVLCLAGSHVLGVFGAEFVRGHGVLILLCCVQLVAALAGPNVQLLNIAGKQSKLIMIFGIGLVVLAALNLALIPIWQLNGAGLAFLLAAAYWHLHLCFVVHRTYGFHGSVIGLLAHDDEVKTAVASGGA